MNSAASDRAAARAHLLRALQHLEEASDSLARAQASLAPVAGAAVARSRLHGLKTRCEAERAALGATLERGAVELYACMQAEALAATDPAG